MDRAAVRERASYRAVFAVREFRSLWLAMVLSVAGDQLAQVALTILVFDRTRSPFLAALTYATSYVPTFVGGLLLSGLADRFPRREVMITCDLIRAGLVAVMAMPGMPLPALVALLFATTMLEAPFRSARTALYPEILTADEFVLGQAVSMATYQAGQVIGFAAGGAIVGLFGTRASLLADAVTFVLSALLIRATVLRRPAAASPGRRSGGLRELATGARLVFGTAALRTPMLFGWLAAFYVVPEGLATPLAAALRGGPVTVGLILAIGAVGSMSGAIVFSRVVPAGLRRRLMGPLAFTSSALLVLLALRPGLILTLVVLLISRMAGCYQTAASAAFVIATPAEWRGQAFGLAQGGMNLGQGAAWIAAGAAARYAAPASVITIAGIIGAVAALSIALTARTRP